MASPQIKDPATWRFYMDNRCQEIAELTDDISVQCEELAGHGDNHYSEVPDTAQAIWVEWE